MEEFVQHPVTGDLTEVPGIGPAAIKILADHPTESIQNTYQLIGKYLALKSNGEDTKKPIDSYEHNDVFWYFLKDRGIKSHRSAVVQAIARKCNSFIPGMYDPTLYEDDDDSDEE